MDFMTIKVGITENKNTTENTTLNIVERLKKNFAQVVRAYPQQIT